MTKNVSFVGFEICKYKNCLYWENVLGKLKLLAAKRAENYIGLVVVACVGMKAI